MVAGRRVGNLPSEVTSFVGRRREVVQARRLLTATRLLTLTGMGGVGKTRLGLRVAAQARRTFPGGVWLVELAPLEDSELLIRTVAAAVGLADRSVRPPMDVLVEFLAERRLLLILDNCEHLLDGCAVLAGKLLGAAPELRVLATSRQPLGIAGEQVLEVPPLSVPEVDQTPAAGWGESEAMRLFVERAAAAAPGFAMVDGNRPAVAAIVRRLDGIPLAIELAAVRLRALSAEQVLERLDDRFRLLTHGSRMALSRQRTLRAAIDWSFELCSLGERAVWARASVFSGDFDLPAAEAVCGGDGIAAADMVELVAGLVDKSVLVRVGQEPGTRYRLLETVRQYGRDRLAESGRETVVRARHRDWYQRSVMQSAMERFGPDHEGWLIQAHRERANVRVALDFCLTAPGQAQAGLAIAAEMRDYWLVFGTTEGCHWLDRALTLAPQRPSRTRAEALWVYVWLALRRGDTASGARRLPECLALARRLGDPAVFVRVVELSGAVAISQGDARRGFALLEQALARYAAGSDPQSQWRCLLHLALATFAYGQPASYGERSLALSEAHDSQWHRGFSLWIAGLERLLQGDPVLATVLLRESLRSSPTVRANIEEPWHIALCLDGLAWASAATGEHERAARLFGAAHPIWRSTGAVRAAAFLADPRRRYEAQARRALGHQAFTAAFQHGTKLTTDQAITYATGEDPAAPPPRTRSVARAVLTRREQQVAELITQGLSNKDIAEKLVIAPRTAESHVANVLTKLGFVSRTQIATWHLSVDPGDG